MNSDSTPFELSRPAKEAIKTALSVTIAMAIALWMDWEKPYWAGFAVAFISLGTEGQSLNKGAMRMFGTLVAIAAAFVFLCWFPQDRWAFMAAVSVYVGFCAYMMTGAKRQYFWYASGFICTVIAADSHDSLSSFQIATERAQETGTGVLVYSLVSALLWPVSAQDGLENANRRLFRTQVRLFDGYRRLMHGEGQPEDLRTLRSEAIQSVKQVGQLLNAAESDSYAVWEVRHQWRQFHALSIDLMENLGHWRTSLPDVKSLDLSAVVPNLADYESELDRRFAQIERMLDGNPPEQAPQQTGLNVDDTVLQTLAPFQAAAVEVTLNQLRRLESISRSMFDSAADLRGYCERSSIASPSELRRPFWVIDLDRLQGVITVLAIYWISFLLYVYVPDIPGKASFWQMSTLFAMLTVMTNSNPVTGLAVPTLVGTVLGGGLYIFVMPHLSGFLQLGILIFTLVLVLARKFSKPNQVGIKASLIANAISAMSIQNEQTYSVAAFAGSLAMNIVACGLLVAIFYLPPSPRPEKTFVRLYRRFFRHAHDLVLHGRSPGNHFGNIAKRLRLAYCAADVLALPGKMAACSSKIDFRSFPAIQPDQVNELVSRLYDLAFRIRDLVDTRGLAKAEIVQSGLSHDLQEWQDTIQARLQNRSDNPTETESSAKLQEMLAAELSDLESRIESMFAQSQPSSEASQSMFRMLGSYRGLAEAETAVAEVAERIKWSQLEEARF